MSNLALTILAAIILMGLVVAGLALGLIITGKSKLRKGCGLTPDTKKGKSSPTCPICGEKQSCEKENARDTDNRKDKI